MATSLDPKAIVSQLADWYLKLPLVQKIVVPLFAVGSVMAIMYVSKMATKPDYAVLYSDLTAVDSSAVLQNLKDQKIKYELRNDGTTIAVSPPEAVHELRLNLAGDGLPKKGSPGLELFDNVRFGMTNRQEREMWIRAIQGELERTISSLEAVESTRVHITQPEKSVLKKGAEPTASVLLKIRSGAELDEKQIRGIANLVAGGVEGLKRENVTIIDILGNLLTPSEEEGPDALGVETTRLQYQRDIEKGYAQRVEQMLSKVLGSGKVVARITADMDFSESERQEETYDPSGQVMRSERSVEEGSGQSQRGGIPGIVSNVTSDPKLLAPEKGNSDLATHRESLKNYEVSKAISKISSPRGKLVKLSVAVLVDSNYKEVAPAPVAADAKGVSSSAAPVVGEDRTIDPSVLAQIEAISRSAVGFDSDRGDTISVEAIPFHKSENDFSELMETKATQELILSTLKQFGLPGMFFLLFFVFVVRPLVKFLTTPTEAELDLSRLLPTGINELEQELEAERSKASLPAFEPTVDMEQLEELVSENSRIVKEYPQQAAPLIRYWLNDGRL